MILKQKRSPQISFFVQRENSVKSLKKNEICGLLFHFFVQREKREQGKWRQATHE
jgi:hypothetical protein